MAEKNFKKKRGARSACPYEGPMGEGWEAYQNGRLMSENPHTDGTAKAPRWNQGWRRAKLAAEQGKSAV